MERGNAKHSPREDDMLAAELSGLAEALRSGGLVFTPPEVAV